MKNDIVALYQNGFSAREVGEKLDVSMKCVYGALKRAQIVRRTPSASNDMRFRRTPLSFTVPTRMTSEQDQLRVCALSLYWGEGAKTASNNHVDIANSDVSVLKIFLRYLREILRVDESRIRVYLYCFDDQDVVALCRYWSGALAIPTAQFQKPHIRSSSGENRGRIMAHGVAHIRYADKRLLAHILQEIDTIKTWAGT